MVEMTELLANQRPEASEVPTWRKAPPFIPFGPPSQMLSIGSGRRCRLALADTVDRSWAYAVQRISSGERCPERSLISEYAQSTQVCS